VPFFCHNNGIIFFAKLFLSDGVKARGNCGGALLPINAAQQRSTDHEQMPSHCFEAATALQAHPAGSVRLDHIASGIVNADHCIM
jgi:hypothetical protein